MMAMVNRRCVDDSHDVLLYEIMNPRTEVARLITD